MTIQNIEQKVREFWAMNYPFGQRVLIDFIRAMMTEAITCQKREVNTMKNDVKNSNETKYIEEKARKIMQIVYDCTNKPHESYEANYNSRMTEYKSFIRTIMKEIEDKHWGREAYLYDTIKELKKQLDDCKPKVDMGSWFYKNCKSQRKRGAKICQCCPFREIVEAQEAGVEVTE